MRNVRIATVSFLIDDASHTQEKNVTRACEYIELAKQKGADIVCLPETVTTLHVPQKKAYQAEQFPGEWTKQFARCARQNRINVIAPYWIRSKDKKFNQATVFDRKGNIAGLYRKVQPHAQELKHILPGDDLPVIQMDFGKIAVMICMDIYFPEIARIYAMKGAEIVFWPTTTVGPSQEGLEAQIKSRAIDNSIYVVESNCAQRPPYAPYAGRWLPGNAKIVDPNGDILAQTGRREGIAIADVDLDAVKLTSQVVMKREPDHTREDMESLTRLDLYASEYAKLARNKESKTRKNIRKNK